MPALNFKKQFAGMVQSGYKRQTIRAERKVPIKRLDKLFLFCGMRTKGCARLRTVICMKVEPIEIKRNDAGYQEVWVDGYKLSPSLVDNLARNDGFDSDNPGRDLFLFFKDRLPFKGQVIYW